MTRAFICGVSGLVLTDEERRFLADSAPWGLILFKRNVSDQAQLLALTTEFREIVGRADAPVLVDQEGGRVQRLGPPVWPAYPAAARFDALTHSDDEKADFVRLSARLIGQDLRACGIDVDCLPVLDVPAPGGHNVIGDRAYAADPAQVARLGGAAAEGLMLAGVLPVMKHVPGHGRAGADSHLELPRVDASLAELERADFVPFRALAHLPMAMTAHVVYTALDPTGPATTSRKVVQEIIRRAIGFDGLLMSDDLSMKALSGSFTDRTTALFAAGADMALHCNGDLTEARQVAAASPELDGRAAERAAAALALIAPAPKPFDPVDARAKLQSALAMTS
ncbi:MAG: beta-N-acetylhexosaminidase [Hyphomicrobiales bacterium]|nr:beta-N-acetylhexosaminidase [Hyphomicrobiales bacterium]